MVLQQRLDMTPRRRTGNDDDGPDPSRILGISGTLAFNAFVLLALLIPNRLPDTLHAVVERAPEFRWVEPPALPPPRPPAAATAPSPQTKAPPVVPLQSRTPPTPTPRTDTRIPAFDVATTVNRIETDIAVVANPAALQGEPSAGVQLQYASAPSPDYPRNALRRGVEGVVHLQVLVDRNGQPLEVRVHRSSGNRELDQAALRQVQRYWTFQPAMQDGKPVQAMGIVPIAFNLDLG